ncbi:MAG: succinate dehydrogenase assembly factor 2 [Desulfarculaceae bacterium]
MPGSDIRLKRLRMTACRRGLLEAELALRPFVKTQLMKLTDEELDDFERLLGMEDLDLWQVLCGKRTSESGIDARLIEKIRSCLPGPCRI